MNIRSEFTDTNLTSLEYWGRKIAIALADMQMRELHDGFSVSEVNKVSIQGVTFEIKGTDSECRYKNSSLLASDSISSSKRQNGIIEGRRKLVDFYVHIRQQGLNGSPTISFSAVGHMPHINKMGGVQDVEYVTEKTMQDFLRRTEKAMEYMKPIFADRAEKMTRKIKKRDSRASQSPWGQPYIHQ